MQAAMRRILFFACLLTTPSWGLGEAKDRTITKVVKLLQSMLEKSKTEGDTERELYGKYKCYCDTSDADKVEEIDTATNTIEQLEGSIDTLLASTGTLSKDVAHLQAEIDANAAEQAKAQTIRDYENGNYTELKSDLQNSITTMGLAIQELADVGGDQTLQAGADHDQFLAKKDDALIKLKSSVKQALLAASAFVSKKQALKIESFLQAPFTATYTSQSGEVVGILKEMRDTFSSTLEAANTAEEVAAAAHEKYMKNAGEAKLKMENSRDRKQQTLGSNDQDLALQKGQLESAETTKSDAEQFLTDLREMCSDKAKEYDQRVLLRTNEQAAIAQAISILNSDSAFATFGASTATSEGGTGPKFLQLRAVHRHMAPEMAVRQRAQSLLQRAAGSRKSPMLSKAVALLQANNPFATVLKEIAKMIDLIDEEQKADEEQLSWCNDERTTNDGNHADKVTQIKSLKEEIRGLKNDINNPEDGLLAMIEENENALATNIESQKTETKTRTEANLDYQNNIANLVEAEALLAKAIKVLKAYYDQILKEDSLAQLKKDEPTPPDTWDDETKAGRGQSGDGNSAITMLEFILDETKKEETAAHDQEKKDQHEFEDDMKELHDDEISTSRTIADLRLKLANTQKTLLGKKEDKKKTEADKKAIEEYLEKIKDGCDFITTNFDTRETNRGTEKEALEGAVTLIEGTPAYLTYKEQDKNETLGDCLGICNKREEHVECKACLAKVTVPGYCAGHPDTTGCN